MIPAIPWYITAIVVATNLAIAAGVWRLVASATPHRGVRLGTALFLGAWLGAAFLLAPAPELAARTGPVLRDAAHPAVRFGAGGGRAHRSPPLARVPSGACRDPTSSAPRHPGLPRDRGRLRVPAGPWAAAGPLRPAGRLGRHRDRGRGPGGRVRAGSRCAGGGCARGLLECPRPAGPGGRRRNGDADSSLRTWRPGSARGCRPPRPWGSSLWCWCRSSRYRCR